MCGYPRWSIEHSARQTRSTTESAFVDFDIGFSIYTVYIVYIILCTTNRKSSVAHALFCAAAKQNATYCGRPENGVALANAEMLYL